MRRWSKTIEDVPTLSNIVQSSPTRERSWFLSNKPTHIRLVPGRLRECSSSWMSQRTSQRRLASEKVSTVFYVRLNMSLIRYVLLQRSARLRPFRSTFEEEYSPLADSSSGSCSGICRESTFQYSKAVLEGEVCFETHTCGEWWWTTAPSKLVDYSGRFHAERRK